MNRWIVIYCALVLGCFPCVAQAEGDWEITAESDAALERGLKWLAANQGPEGNWESNDLGLVGMGALAFLSAGHRPGHGKYGPHVEKALDYMLKNAKPSGLLNISSAQRDMYNHGLATFVLGQAYGVTTDARISPVLDKALKLIAFTQCENGGWDYQARRQKHGHDLSLAVMQAKALRGAVDSGLEVSPEVINLAIKSVRAYYRASSGKQNFDDPAVRAEPGQFTYDGNRTSLAMAACGVVCLQEFGEYDDWRIERNLQVLVAKFGNLPADGKHGGQLPVDAYTLYYCGQALYQVGGKAWQDCYPRIREALIASQRIDTNNPVQDGHWTDTQHVSGKPGQLYGTAVGCFVLAIPNRYLPILQEGKIDSLKRKPAN
ncbi:MAG: squalene--hopene cyclase [Planctomycetes bacterium]|nr:squalene--hopene cyclase [Planctomycetota bacterium]